VSSDPFADLADSVGVFAFALRGLMAAHDFPAESSPAATEAAGEPHAGEWSPHPGRDLLFTIRLAAWSCADHLGALSVVLRERRLIAPLYTLARGAAEAAGIACYLAERGIDSLERVRRDMNCNLQALTEDINMLNRLTGPDAKAKAERHTAHIGEIEREGKRSGLRFHAPERYRAGYLGDKPPSAMTMISNIASRVPSFGAISQQLLSGVAHAKLHGLARFIVPVGSPGPDPGKVKVDLTASGHSLAIDLIVAPLCASTLVEQLRWFLGWETDELNASVVPMLHTWGRITGIPDIIR
jgi:hypothetical protein